MLQSAVPQLDPSAAQSEPLCWVPQLPVHPFEHWRPHLHEALHAVMLSITWCPRDNLTCACCLLNAAPRAGGFVIPAVPVGSVRRPDQQSLWFRGSSIDQSKVYS